MGRKGTLKGIQSDKMKAEFQSVFQLVLFRLESWNNDDINEDQLLQEAYSNYQPSDIEKAKKDVQKQIFDLKGEANNRSILQIISEVIMEMGINSRIDNKVSLIQFRLAELTLGNNFNGNWFKFQLILTYAGIDESKDAVDINHPIHFAKKEDNQRANTLQFFIGRKRTQEFLMNLKFDWYYMQEEIY